MTVLHTPEAFIAHLGLAPDATPDQVAAAVTQVGADDDTVIEAAIDRRFFPELASSVTPVSAATATSHEQRVLDSFDSLPLASPTFPGRL